MVGSKISDLAQQGFPGVLEDWLPRQLQSVNMRSELIKETELRSQSEEFLIHFAKAVSSGELTNTRHPVWAPVLEHLEGLSRERGRMGFSPSETATFIFSLKPTLISKLRAGTDRKEGFLEEITAVNELLDQLGLFTTEIHQKAREEVINRQQMEMLELSTPVVSLWEGVVALPLIGTLDSSRTNVVMESLLEQIVKTRSEIAIIDITGVLTVDTLVAQHLLKTVAAARLMGAECIISGIRPQIAQTMVHLGIDLTSVSTKATMADALRAAVHRLGFRFTRLEIVK